VLDRLNKANLKLNSDQCTWFSQEVSLLGHIVNTSGIHMDPKKVHAIQAMLPPMYVKQVQQFWVYAITTANSSQIHIR
jgi:hypothetical protein